MSARNLILGPALYEFKDQDRFLLQVRAQRNF